MSRLFSDAQKTYSIAYKFYYGIHNKIFRLFENNPNYLKTKYQIKQPLWVNAFLEELYCYSSIQSLSEIGIPPISTEDDEYIRLQKILNYEWQTPRYELFLYVGNSRGIVAEVGRVALKNSQGYPYRRHRLIDLFTDNTSFLLGEGDYVACKLDLLGNIYGLNDVVTLTGCWKQEIILVPEQQLISNVINVAASNTSPSPSPTPTPVADTTTTKQFSNSNSASPTTIADANTKRKSLTVTAKSGGGFVNKIDTSPIQSYELYFGVQNSPPSTFFTDYKGRVTIAASAGNTLSVEVVETSNP